MLDRTDPFARESAAERTRLADLLASLDPDQWGAGSLCVGCRVREVGAHMTMPYRHTGQTVPAGIAAAGGDFIGTRTIRRGRTPPGRPRRDAGLPCGTTSNTPGSRSRGPGRALSHDVIHGLDITEPLGLPRPPADRVRLVLGAADERQLAFFGVDRTVRRLEATDTELALGDGQEVTRLPAADILLAVTGRTDLDPPIR
ncbi:maleylpyruvate isomerase N-terminal domain-containing protein [Nakamurella sp.]|uniref:maleylpyruvate isomerase N-terminal domain-containing protein n=1 Tax=Nakamurella sp. TaxID=1869182 RepID=UPI0037830BE7